MRILLVGSFEYPIYAPAFEAGFKSLGNEVCSIKTEDFNYGDDNNIICSFLNRILFRFHIGWPLRAYNRDIINKAKSFLPDFIFLYSCCSIWEKTVKDLREMGFFVFTYNNDDPFSGVPDKYYYRFFLRTIKYANVNFVYRKKNLIDYEYKGIVNTKVLLPYYISTKNFHVECEDDIPIAFIGHYENDGRDKMILSLKKAGLPVKIFSGLKYWKQSLLYNELEDIISPGAYGIEYNNLLNRIKVALVFLSKINSDTYTRRCFEIPATSTLMLCEYTDDMNALFPEDECACYFRDKDDLIRKASYLLVHPEVISKIATNACERLKVIGGSEVDRCKEIINVYQEYNNCLK